MTEENYQAVLEDLHWLGLEWDEGPEVGGRFGPYRQSERFDRYDVAARHLRTTGAAYPCYCTAEELERRRKMAQAERRPPGYDGRCRNLTSEEIEAFETEGRKPSLRFRVPEETTVTFDDVVRGPIKTETRQIPDFVIQRSDGSPTYMLAATVDDVEMDITHIIRGEDLVTATPRQLLMRSALGIEEVPVLGHLPLIVDEKGRPLSKRWGDVAVRAYREAGVLPEALVNYLALLGWSYDDRTNIFSLDELVAKFSLERVGKNPAAFDVAKLEWLNGHYIRQKSPEDLAESLIPICLEAGLDADSEQGRKLLAKVAPLLTERMKRLTEAPPMVRFLFDDDVRPDEKAAKVLEGQSEYLRDVQARLTALDKWTAPAIEESLRALAEERGLKPKQAFQPIRAAVTGTLVSPPLFESLEILGREKTLSRLERVG